MPLEIFLNLEEYLLELMKIVKKQLFLDLKNEFQINHLLFYQINTSNWEKFSQSLQTLNLTLSPIQQELWQDHFSVYTINIQSLQQELKKTQKILEMLIFNTYRITTQELRMFEKNNSLKCSHK